MYIPKAIKQMRTPVMLLSPAEAKRYNGVAYQGELQEIGTIFVNWKSYGGTETTLNGVYSIEDTAQVTTRYRPDIKANCHLKLANGRIYKILGEPLSCFQSQTY